MKRSNTDLLQQFKARGLQYDSMKSVIQLTADLMNYDRSNKGIEVKAIVKDVVKTQTIQIEYEKAKKGK